MNSADLMISEMLVTFAKKVGVDKWIKNALDLEDPKPEVMTTIQRDNMLAYGDREMKLRASRAIIDDSLNSR